MGLVIMDNPHKQVHDPLLDVWSEGHELAIHSVENGLQIVPFARVLTVK